MTKLYQYKSKDPNGSYAWLHTELFGTLEELKAQHPLDESPEWREVHIVPRKKLEWARRHLTAANMDIQEAMEGKDES